MNNPVNRIPELPLVSDISLRDQAKETRKNCVIALTESCMNVIPYVPAGTIIKDAITQISCYRDIRFCEKLESFLWPLTKSLDWDDFERFWSKVDNEKEKEKIAQYLIGLLDAAECDEKASMMGSIYRAAVLGSINHEEMLRLCDIIRKCFIIDLNALPQYVEPNDEDTVSTQNLINLGLINNYSGGYWQNDSKVSLNELGEKLFNILADAGYFKINEK